LSIRKYRNGFFHLYLFSIEIMSQTSVRGSWKSQTPITYDCRICLTTNTKQLLQLPCGHNVNKKKKETEDFFMFELVVFIMSSYDLRSFTIGLPILSMSFIDMAST